MIPDEWHRVQHHVTDAMLEHTRPFTTPLTRGSETTVWLEGSGSYVAIDDKRLLLTCEHVAIREALDFRFHGSVQVYGYRGKWTMEPQPVDIAFGLPIDKEWAATSHKALAIPYARFAQKHQVCEQAELLFFRGYAGENARYGFGVHRAGATGYCSQEKQDSGDDSIFEIFWEPENTQFSSGTSAEARAGTKVDDPGGMSGSLVWNTRYLEALKAGRNWSPKDAIVTGLLRRWDKTTKTLLVYRVEHLRAWLDARLT
jgi:hypothetical protein